MPFRFRRSLKIFPGVKVDLSKGGLSTSIGGKGFHMNVGRRGVLPTVSLPGTGMSYTGDNLLASSPLSFNQNYPGQPKAQSDRPSRLPTTALTRDYRHGEKAEETSRRSCLSAGEFFQAYVCCCSAPLLC